MEAVSVGPQSRRWTRITALQSAVEDEGAGPDLGDVSGSSFPDNITRPAPPSWPRHPTQVRWPSTRRRRCHVAVRLATTMAVPSTTGSGGPPSASRPPLGLGRRSDRRSSVSGGTPGRVPPVPGAGAGRCRRGARRRRSGQRVPTVSNRGRHVPTTPGSRSSSCRSAPSPAGVVEHGVDAGSWRPGVRRRTCRHRTAGDRRALDPRVQRRVGRQQASAGG